MKIAVIHAGYSGIALATVLSSANTVCLQDTSARLVARINAGDCPISCPDTARLLAQAHAGEVDLDLKAVRGMTEACKGADFLVVTTLPSFDPVTATYDTTQIERDIAAARSANAKAWIVVRTKVPVGFMRRVMVEKGDRRMLFSPEFVHEHTAYANTYAPDRVIVGANRDDPEAVEAANRYADAVEAASAPKAERIVAGLPEAETIKLFTDHWRALRKGFVNEVDTYCAEQGYDVRKVMPGVCFDECVDPNPSIACDGHFVPDRAKDYLNNYPKAPRATVEAIVAENNARLDFIAGEVVRGVYHAVYASGTAPLVGFFRPTDNGYDSDCETTGLRGLSRRIGEKGIPTLVFEPRLREGEFEGMQVTHDLDKFKQACSLIVTARWHHELEDVREKVYTRDLHA